MQVRGEMIEKHKPWSLRRAMHAQGLALEHDGSYALAAGMTAHSPRLVRDF